MPTNSLIYPKVIGILADILLGHWKGQHRELEDRQVIRQQKKTFIKSWTISITLATRPMWPILTIRCRLVGNLFLGPSQSTRPAADLKQIDFPSRILETLLILSRKTDWLKPGESVA